MKYCGKEKISIIIIVYNVEEYLQECVESIRKQTYENIEIILVNDGSNDKSGILCDKFAQCDNRIRVVHKENGGLVSARQAGIKVATGEYVAFVDGDDWVDDDMYEKLYLECRLHNVDMVLSGIVREFPDHRKCDLNAISNGYYSKERLEAEIYPNMMYSMEWRSCLIDPSLCNKLFSMSVIRAALLQVDPAIFYLGEDAATTFPCLLGAKSIYVTDFCMYHHRIIVKENDVTYKREKVYERLLNFYRNLKQNFEKTVYAQITIPQLNGYFLHLLTVITREAIDLDIMTFFQYLMDYNKAPALEEKKFVYELPFNELGGYQNIVLYGAGKVGREYFQQLKDAAFNVVLWADKQYAVIENSGLPVRSIQEIKNLSYDVIVLAAKREQMADSMRKDLLESGIEEKRIKWIKPVENA